MLLETIERVNRLRQQALNDPKFLHSAKEHEKALKSQTHRGTHSTQKTQARKERRLADIYQQAEFGQPSDNATH
ncbi:hypothetical protein FCU94_07780 [Vibrio sp. JPW-9-11-11]|uniref:hypothetical protein n=1 Tax=Vibrio sp. JPW-9-11-11 TaxID=1416532 RepID=UPI001594A038|nr:hypothetical protein [Vibrio sp. JPW-9-11-11]NVD06809.1 hypothetical protein [Vibrio sp. JPW-9-11-11]